MKKITLLLMLVCLTMNQKLVSKPLAFKLRIKSKPDVVLNRLTIYNPVAGQTDSSPLITANNSKINLHELKRSKLRWMALSQDQIKSYNKKAKFSYGDTLVIHSGDKEIDGEWVLMDTMNKMYTKTGDLLYHSDNKDRGLWSNVKVTRKKNIKI